MCVVSFNLVHEKAHREYLAHGLAAWEKYCVFSAAASVLYDDHGGTLELCGLAFDIGSLVVHRCGGDLDEHDRISVPAFPTNSVLSFSVTGGAPLISQSRSRRR